MKWLRQGRVLSPRDCQATASRLMCPTPIRLVPGEIAVFVGCCDANGISRPWRVDLDEQDPLRVKRVAGPLLDIGEAGTFDDNGLCPTSVVRSSKDGNLRMYYFGFQLGVRIPFYMFSGLALSADDGRTWKRHSRTPVLDRSNGEPIMRSGPCVVERDKAWHVFYPSGNRFIEVAGKKVHEYRVLGATSVDGLAWPQSGEPMLWPQDSDEYGFGRPWIVPSVVNRWEMLYSIRTRSRGYHLGVATSSDGLVWDRCDSSFELEGTAGDWEREMQCYSSTFTTSSGEQYLLYNGNNLGATGFGLAKRVA